MHLTILKKKHMEAVLKQYYKLAQFLKIFMNSTENSGSVDKEYFMYRDN